MNKNLTNVRPHPRLLDMLFACKSNISLIFKDVLGLHEINHISVTRIDHNQEILIFSSTPAMEYNLFTGNLWTFDNTWNPAWFQLCTRALWETLYHPEHYDELYYSRQIKHHFSAGLSLAVFEDNAHYIYSLASSMPAPQGLEIFMNNQDDFGKIGKYCKNLLNPYFMNAGITEHISIE